MWTGITCWVLEAYRPWWVLYNLYMIHKECSERNWPHFHFSLYYTYAHAFLKNTCILTQMTPEAMYIEKEKGLEDFLKQVFSVLLDIHLYVRCIFCAFRYTPVCAMYLEVSEYMQYICMLPTYELIHKSIICMYLCTHVYICIHTYTHTHAHPHKLGPGHKLTRILHIRYVYALYVYVYIYCIDQ